MQRLDATHLQRTTTNHKLNFGSTATNISKMPNYLFRVISSSSFALVLPRNLHICALMKLKLTKQCVKRNLFLRLGLSLRWRDIIAKCTREKCTNTALNEKFISTKPCRDFFQDSPVVSKRKISNVNIKLLLKQFTAAWHWNAAASHVVEASILLTNLARYHSSNI